MDTQPPSSSSDVSGLHREAARLRSEENNAEERIRFIRSGHRLRYERAEVVLDLLELLYREGLKENSPSYLLVEGPEMNGKTTVAREFLKRHPAETDRIGKEPRHPVVYTDAPAVPRSGRFAEGLLWKLGVPVGVFDSCNAEEKTDEAIKRLKETEANLLIIDQFEHFSNGSTRQQEEAVGRVLRVAEALSMPVVALGLPEESRGVIASHREAQRAFQFEALPRWTAGEAFSKLLDGFEKLLPLRKPSGLSEEPMSEKLLDISEGRIGSLSDAITGAAVQAIKSGTERVTTALLDEATSGPESGKGGDAWQLINEGE